MMTMFCLELVNTENWTDVRYRDYTTSRKKAEAFKRIPKIPFTNNGHGIVAVVTEKGVGPRKPRQRELEDHVREYLWEPDRP